AGVGTGEMILTAAVREPSTGMPAEPGTVVTLTEGVGGKAAQGTAAQGTVSGVKVGVQYAEDAAFILVPARLEGGGNAVAVVDRSAAGISLHRTPASGGAPEYTLRLASTPITGMLGVGETGAGDAGD